MSHSGHKIISHGQVLFEDNLSKIPGLTERLNKRSEFLKKTKDTIKTVSKTDISRVKDFADDLLSEVTETLKEDFVFLKEQSQRGNLLYDKMAQEEVSNEEMIKFGKMAADGDKNCCKRFVSYCQKYDQDGNLKKPDFMMQTMSKLLAKDQDLLTLYCDKLKFSLNELVESQRREFLSNEES